MIAAQGGDPNATMRVAPLRETVLAPYGGVLSTLDALKIGVAAWRLGAGRARKEDPVSAAAGLLVLAREGDYVEKGQPLFELHADDDAHMDFGRRSIHESFQIDGTRAAVLDLVVERIS
jgi:thymidine phosphorylase